MQATAAANLRIPLTLSSHVRPAQLLGWGAIGVLCLGVGALLKYPEAVESPGSDTGMFATYGAMLLHGARPYVDFWDLHPPLVYLYWAVVQALAGPDWLRTCSMLDGLTPSSCTALLAHGVDLLLSVATAVVVAGIVRRAGGSMGVAALAAVLVVGFADQVMLSQEGSNPSKLTLLPSCVAVWAYLGDGGSCRGWRGALVAGIAGAIAGLAKQPALLTLAALVSHAAWRRDRTSLAGLLLGSGATLGLACASLAAVGSLDEFIAQAWIYNVQRALVGYFAHPVKAPVIGLDRVLTESAGLLVALAVLGGFRIARWPAHPAQRLLVWWALLNLVTVTAFREFAYVVPSLAALGAFGGNRIWRRLDALSISHRALGRCVLVVVGAASIVLTTSFERTQLARARFEHGSSANVSATETIGQMLRQAFPGGPLFVYGNGAQMYQLSGRMPATRYVNAEALRTTAPGVELSRVELVAALAADPPPLIVLAPHSDEVELNLAGYPAMHAFLQACYARDPSGIDLDPGWTILLRSEACRI